MVYMVDMGLEAMPDRNKMVVRWYRIACNIFDGGFRFGLGLIRFGFGFGFGGRETPTALCCSLVAVL